MQFQLYPRNPIMKSPDSKRSDNPGRMTKHPPQHKIHGMTNEGATIGTRTEPAQTAASRAGMHNVRIFDPAEALKRLREIHGNQYFETIRIEPHSNSIAEQVKALRAYSDHDLIIGNQHEINPNPNLKDEDIIRSRRLHDLLEDEQDGCRDPLVATSAMIAAIRGLRTIAPQFETVVGVIENGAAMSLVTGQPIQVPPILLLGPPGIGKTFFAKRLAAAIGSAFLPLSMNLTPSFGLLAGLSPVWRGAGPGKIASMLIDSPNAAPVILFDEIEKVVVASAHDRPLDVLHSLWEPENAETFRDEYYDMAFNVSHIISVATANSIAGIAPSLLDRLLVLNINPPTFEQRRAIAGQAYATAIEKVGGLMDAVLPDAILDQLAVSTPRRITRMIGLALPMAVAANRRALTPADIITAAKLLDSAKVKERPSIGFIRRES
jgi:ATP-dependent Lon protease